jgi:hypothetical protein
LFAAITAALKLGLKLLAVLPAIRAAIAQPELTGARNRRDVKLDGLAVNDDIDDLGLFRILIE